MSDLGDSEWKKDSNGNLAPRDGERVSPPGIDNINGDKRCLGYLAFVYRDGNDAVAIDRDGARIDRGTDHGAVIASADSHVSGAVSADGTGTVLIGKGTFEVSSGTLKTYNRSYRGVGREETVIKMADGADLSHVIERGNGEIQDLTIDRNGANQSTSPTAIRSNDFDQLHVENVRFKGSGGRAVNADGGTTNVRVTGCIDENGSGFRCAGSAGEDWSVTDCRVKGGGNIIASGGDHVTFANNIVAGTTAKNSIVAVQVAQEVSMTGNSVRNGGIWGLTVGIEAANVSITGNTVQGHDLGITLDTVLDNGTVIPGFCAVTGNTVRGCATTGININRTPDCTVGDNVVENCARGIMAVGGSDSDPATISGNTVSNCSVRGIGASTGTVVVGNSVRDCGSGGSNEGGIRAAADENVINSNRVIGCDPDGIQVDASGDNNTVVGNTLLRNVTNQLNDAGTNTTKTGNNTS